MPNCTNCKAPDATLPVEGHFANEPEGTEHFCCSEACQRHTNKVFQGIRERAALRNFKTTCPCCGETLTFFCGGPGFYWVECGCGHYSDPATDAAGLQAICSDIMRWHPADPGLNCYPPIGG